MPGLPEWQPLERIADHMSGGAAGGRVVAIVASEGAVAAGWSEHAAVSIAKTWSLAGQKVMLIDGSLNNPGLHTATGVSNEEGLSDATLYGASVARVARRIEDGGYFLMTAGTAVADPQAVVRSPRWDRLARGFVEAGVTLGVFLRDGERGTAAFLGSASEIVVLAGQGEPAPGAIRDLEPLVRVVTGVTTRRGVEPRRSEARPVGRPSGKAPARTGRAVLLVALAVVLAVVLAAVLGLITIPGISPQAEGPTQAPAFALTPFPGRG